jgi:hypothetical protein
MAEAPTPISTAGSVVRSTHGEITAHGNNRGQNAAASITDRNRSFLEAVLPWPGAQDPGYINLHSHSKNPDPNKNGGKDFVVGWPHQNINDFLNRAKWVETAANYYDVWFCTSLQKDSTKTKGGTPKAIRLARNALLLKALWVDIDVKSNDPNHYAAITGAIDAISLSTE